ncbi:hypothetical protein [Phenylobacterium sp. Root700]|uniref:hypothetical protein n=1 Tax=Phenylobacterium sp. Root700 TaxID=1736591 RepID=UPI0007006BFE|nr:hypothetical protein [Phenylobacterium sp. Root700]KRB49673.1 hypothetical protein ASE02_17890 [Phenylobacterium sp. Root700]
MLTCRETPASAALLAILDVRRERGEPPPHSNQFYPALVEALRAERQSVGWQLHRRILYVDDAYVTPFQCLASARAPKCLWGAVPVYRGGVLADAYLALGAAPIARDQHWTAFFEWIDARAKRSATATLTATERGLLLEAYRRISGPPEGLSDTAKWLLSDRGTVHSLTELREDRFLENDFPELAEALKAAAARWRSRRAPRQREASIACCACTPSAMSAARVG